MFKKVLAASVTFMFLLAANSQDLVQNVMITKSKEDTIKSTEVIAKPKPTYAIVGTDSIKVETPQKLEDSGEELYKIYSDKGSGSAYRKKKYGDSVPHSADPFAWGDFSWMNGQSRKTSAPAFDSKYFTGDLTFDINSTYSFADPIDNTVVGSTALSRNNEVQISYIGLGGDVHYGNARGRLMFQFGTRTTVSRNDVSSYKGQYDLQTIYRYLNEAYGGYHWDKWHGINLDAGIFLSYIGLFSYNNFENWGYQPSYTSDNTPWFFNGLRLQTFPTDRLKLEYWLVNGWQSYGTLNHTPGFGFSIYYRPVESIAWVFNNYYGHDDQLLPTRFRFHLDYSFLLRYYNNPNGKGIKKAAISFTGDFGGEDGAGVSTFGHKLNTYPQNFISSMLYHRLWLGNCFAWTFGGGFMHNPGQYLILAPVGYADSLFQKQAGNGSKFDAWDCSTTFEWDVSQNVTVQIEYVHRKLIDIHSAPGTVPDMKGYFAGHGGVTGPNGYQVGNGYTYSSDYGSIAPPYFGPNGLSNTWQPDLSTHEDRIIFALMLRF